MNNSYPTSVAAVLCDAQKRLFIVQNTREKWQLTQNKLQAGQDPFQEIAHCLWTHLGLSPNSYTILGQAPSDNPRQAILAVRLKREASIFLNNKRIYNYRFIEPAETATYLPTKATSISAALRLFSPTSLVR